MGVGGNVSQGVLKALALSPLPHRVIAACINATSIGLYQADVAYVSPLASSPDFLPWMLELCERERVDAILSGAEPVLEALSRDAPAIAERTGAVCVVSPPDVLEVGQDKLLTCRWLADRDLPYPRFADAEDADEVSRLVDEIGYPLLAKPRRGKGAQGVARVSSQAELDYFTGRPDYVLQEYLADPSAEFTAGAFCDSHGDVRGTLVMRRDLQEGTTIAAEVVRSPEIRAEVERIVRQLRPMGPCNVQLRVVGGRPVPFELNVRFSGTTPVRARLGFNEVDAALRHFVLGEEDVELPDVTGGVALRYWNEMYVSEEALVRLRDDGWLDEPRGHHVQVEDWGLEG